MRYRGSRRRTLGEDGLGSRRNELTGGESRRAETFAIEPTMETRTLAEELFRRLRLDEGLAKVELCFQNRHLEFIWRHDCVMLKRLAEPFGHEV